MPLVKDACKRKEYDSVAYSALVKEDEAETLAFEPNHHLFQSFTHCLRALASEGVGNEVGEDIIESGAIELIHEILNFRPLFPRRIIQACSFWIATLSNQISERSDLMLQFWGLMPFIFEIIRSPDCSVVCRSNALNALINFTCSAQRDRYAVYRYEGTMDCLMECLNDEQEMILDRALSVLYNLARNDEVLNHLGEDLEALFPRMQRLLEIPWETEDITISLLDITGLLLSASVDQGVKIGIHLNLANMLGHPSEEIHFAAARAILHNLSTSSIRSFTAFASSPNFLPCLLEAMEYLEDWPSSFYFGVGAKTIEFGERLGMLQCSFDEGPENYFLPDNPLYDLLYTQIDFFLDRESGDTAVEHPCLRKFVPLLLDYTASGHPSLPEILRQ